MRRAAIVFLGLAGGLAACGGAPMSIEDAARHADTKRIRELVENGVDPNVTVDGLPLIVAIERSSQPHDPSILRFLVERGVKVDSANPAWGNTALHEACVWGNFTHIVTLLELGADPNARTVDGETPLMLLPSLEDAEAMRIVEEFVKRGFDPGVRDKSGRTAADRIRTRHMKATAQFLDDLSAGKRR